MSMVYLINNGDLRTGHVFKDVIRAFFTVALLGFLLSISAASHAVTEAEKHKTVLEKHKAEVEKYQAKGKDLVAINALRANLEKAYLSRNQKDFSKVLTEDFVYLQKNTEGPSTYGRKYFFDYLPALDPITKIEIKPIKEVDVYGDWAVESGQMFMDVVMDGEASQQVAQYMRLLYREKGGWKLAREITAMAEDQGSIKRPPKPGFITNAGKGHFVPRQSPKTSAEAREVDEYSDLVFADSINTQEFVLPIVQKYAFYHPDDFLMINPCCVVTWGQYLAARQGYGSLMIDEVEKYYQEIIVDGDFAVGWGHSVSASANKETGERHALLVYNMYLFRKNENGEWRIWEGWYHDVLRG